jgi:hypothetical protein
MICPKCFDKGKKVEMIEVYSKDKPVKMCPECGHEEGKGVML